MNKFKFLLIALILALTALAVVALFTEHIKVISGVVVIVLLLILNKTR